MAKAIHPSPATTTKSMLASFLFLASKKDLEKKRKNLEEKRLGDSQSIGRGRVAREDKQEQWLGLLGELT